MNGEGMRKILHKRIAKSDNMTIMKKEPFGDDRRKFTWLAGCLTCLVLLALTVNILQDTVLAGAGEYVKRRIYYEKEISRKGLSLHEGKYWKEKE